MSTPAKSVINDLAASHMRRRLSTSKTILNTIGQSTLAPSYIRVASTATVTSSTSITDNKLISIIIIVSVLVFVIIFIYIYIRRKRANRMMPPTVINVEQVYPHEQQFIEVYGLHPWLTDTATTVIYSDPSESPAS